MLTPRTEEGLGWSSFQVTPSSILRHRPVETAYIVLGSFGSKAKDFTVPRRLNIRQDCPASWVIYAPVMSQAIRTVLVSCGLTVGKNCAPPPPGPITRKSPGPAPQQHSSAATNSPILKIPVI